ncbi:hypothetical protein TorRG33x02_211140, partial [Trema orientale]
TTRLQPILFEVAFLEKNRLAALEKNGVQNGGVIGAEIKRRRRQGDHGEGTLRVVGNDLDLVKVEAALLVRVSDGDVQREAVGERVVGSGCTVTESRKGGVGYGEFKLFGFGRRVHEDEDEGHDDCVDDNDSGNAATPGPF